MNQALTYLMDEICSGAEIYFTGRTGGQYLKTTYILCDDYTELVSKLYLLTNDPSWTDTKGNNRFKTYYDVKNEVNAVVAGKMPEKIDRITELQDRMKQRRTRRNDFFHSTSLLDLSVTQRNCVEAFCDLIEYGALLLGEEWKIASQTARNLETLEVLLQLERLSFSDPSVTAKVNQVLCAWPRNTAKVKAKGAHVSEYPEDLHLRLCVTCGGKRLRDKLLALLPN